MNRCTVGYTMEVYNMFHAGHIHVDSNAVGVGPKLFDKTPKENVAKGE